MRHFYLLCENAVPMPAMANLMRHGELWDGDAIVLRHASRNTDAGKVLSGPIGLSLTIMQLLGGTQLEAVGIYRLEPKATAQDRAPDDRAFTRYRILLQCKPGVLWTFENETISPKTGDCWWMDHGPDGEGTIEVRNKSDDDLIVLAFDIRLDR